VENNDRFCIFAKKPEKLFCKKTIWLYCR
jgi:hypothetical protein